jgi:hypothetical protein
MALIAKNYRTKEHSGTATAYLRIKNCRRPGDPAPDPPPVGTPPPDYVYGQWFVAGHASVSVPFANVSIGWQPDPVSEHQNTCNIPGCPGTHFSPEFHAPSDCAWEWDDCGDHTPCLQPLHFLADWNIGGGYSGSTTVEAAYDQHAIDMWWYCFSAYMHSAPYIFPEEYVHSATITVKTTYETDLHCILNSGINELGGCDKELGSTLNPSWFCERPHDRNPGWLNHSELFFYETLTEHEQINGVGVSHVTVEVSVSIGGYSHHYTGVVNANVGPAPDDDMSGSAWGDAGSLQGYFDENEPCGKVVLDRSYSKNGSATSWSSHTYSNSGGGSFNNVYSPEWWTEMAVTSNSMSVVPRHWHCDDATWQSGWRLINTTASGVTDFAGGYTVTYDGVLKDVDGTERTGVQMQVTEVGPRYIPSTFNQDGTLSSLGYWVHDVPIQFTDSDSHLWRGVWEMSGPAISTDDYGFVGYATSGANKVLFPYVPGGWNDITRMVWHGGLEITNVPALGEPFTDADGDGVPERPSPHYDHEDCRIPISTGVSNLTWDAGRIRIGLEPGGTSAPVLTFDEKSPSMWTKSAGITVSAVGGKVQASGVAAAGQWIQRDWSSYQHRLGGARFAKVAWSASKIGAQVKLYINNHYWILTAATVGANVSLIDLCRPDCEMGTGGTGGGDTTKLGVDASTGKLLVDTGTGRLQLGCCCGGTIGTCAAAQQVQSHVPVELPYSVYYGHTEAVISGIAGNVLTLTNPDGAALGMTANYYAGGTAVVRSGAEKSKRISITSNTASTITVASAAGLAVNDKLIIHKGVKTHGYDMGLGWGVGIVNTVKMEFLTYDANTPLVYSFDNISLYRKSTAEGGFLKVLMTYQGGYVDNVGGIDDGPGSTGLAAAVTGQGDTALYYAGQSHLVDAGNGYYTKWDLYACRKGIVVLDGAVIGEILYGGSEYVDYQNGFVGWGFHWIGMTKNDPFPVFPLDDTDALRCINAGWKATQGTNGVFYVELLSPPEIDGKVALPAAYAVYLNSVSTVQDNQIWTATVKTDTVKHKAGMGCFVGSYEKVFRGIVTGLAFRGSQPSSAPFTLISAGKTETVTPNALGWFESTSHKGDVQVNIDGALNIECRNRHHNRAVINRS